MSHFLWPEKRASRGVDRSRCGGSQHFRGKKGQQRREREEKKKLQKENNRKRKQFLAEKLPKLNTQDSKLKTQHTRLKTQDPKLKTLLLLLPSSSSFRRRRKKILRRESSCRRSFFGFFEGFSVFLGLFTANFEVITANFGQRYYIFLPSADVTTQNFFCVFVRQRKKVTFSVRDLPLRCVYIDRQRSF